MEGLPARWEGGVRGGRQRAGSCVDGENRNGVRVLIDDIGEVAARVHSERFRLRSSRKRRTRDGHKRASVHGNTESGDSESTKVRHVSKPASGVNGYENRDSSGNKRRTSDRSQGASGAVNGVSGDVIRRIVRHVGKRTGRVHRHSERKRTSCERRAWNRGQRTGGGVNGEGGDVVGQIICDVSEFSGGVETNGVRMAAGENVAMRTELPGGGVHGVDRQGVVTKIRYVGIARDSSSYSSDDDKVSGAGDGTVRSSCGDFGTADRMSGGQAGGIDGHQTGVR